MRTIALLAVLGGCSFQGGTLIDGGGGGSGSGSDGGSDSGSGIDAGPCVTWSALDVANECDPAIGTPGNFTLDVATSYILDTDAGTLASAVPGTSIRLPGALVAQAMAGPMVRVVNLVALSIPAGAAIKANGTAPLVFVVHGDATIDGTLVVSAGAGDAAACGAGLGTDGANSGTDPAGGGGGAGGGGFGADGGAGSDGGGGMHGNGKPAGMANGTVDLAVLRGGCAGGAGGADSTNTSGGAAGAAGGALEITAMGSIAIGGTVDAAGGGGGGGMPGRGGGGGGGAGDAILLDGGALAVTGSLCANGGGGGEGNGSATGMNGDPGTCSETVRAPGGAGGQTGAGDGGAGGGFTMPKGDPSGSPGPGGVGGGGGGGSVGRIRAHSRGTSNLGGATAITPMPAT